MSALYMLKTTVVQYAVADSPEAARALGREKWRRDVVTVPGDAMGAEVATGEAMQGWAEYEPYGVTDCTVGQWLAGDGDGE